MRATKTVKIRMDNVSFGGKWETLEKGPTLFNRIENTLVKKGIAHNMTSIDDRAHSFYCSKITVTYNTAN